MNTEQHIATYFNFLQICWHILAQLGTTIGKTLSYFFFTYSQSGPISLIYLYSIHRAICRPSGHSVVRPRAEIRTRDGQI